MAGRGAQGRSADRKRGRLREVRAAQNGGNKSGAMSTQLRSRAGQNALRRKLVNVRARSILMAPLWGILVILSLVGMRAAGAQDAVTEWTLIGDSFGEGLANWRTLAIMHRAMHDALNAALPIYSRWEPPEPGEPSSYDALPQAAMVAAARQVLLALHPDRQSETDGLYHRALARLTDGPERRAGIELGEGVAAAAVRRRKNDGYEHAYPFPVSTEPGHWRPVPPLMDNGSTTSSRPFLFASRAEVPARPPPALGGAVYLRDVAETRRMGGLDAPDRTPAQTAAAFFWAFQESKRGFMSVAVDMLSRYPRRGGVFEEARILSQLATALADSAIVVWIDKERFSAWRPITLIRLGGFGVTPDPNWVPLVPTPPHPEYPSGHACDCYVGAGLLRAVFGDKPITYHPLGGKEPAFAAATGMGQHAQLGVPGAVLREFPSLSAAAQNCADSRIWAGAHLRSADEEARRIAGVIVERALASVPAVLPDHADARSLQR